jgi:hypothetical protein
MSVDGHDCDGECIICQKQTCEFCGEVSHKGILYCDDHSLEVDNEEEE